MVIGMNRFSDPSPPPAPGHGTAVASDVAVSGARPVEHGVVGRPPGAAVTVALTTDSTVADPPVSPPQPGERIALVASLLIAGGALAVYLYRVTPYVRFPADVLMWAESDFVGTIIKLRTGQPLYGLPQDSNSIIYTPGPAILTYLIASVLGNSASIPVLRAIQLGYVGCAVLLATRCTTLLRRLVFPSRRFSFPVLWSMLTILLLALAATSPNVNRYVHNLHSDALALLVSTLAFWVVLNYVRRPDWPWLIALVFVPAVGYFTKQFLVSWFGVIFTVLACRSDRRWPHLVAFVVLSIALVGATIAACVYLWGDNFRFWTFEIMGGSRRRLTLASPDSIGLIRSADHLLRAWPELLIGLIGGVLALHARPTKSVRLLWFGWILLVGSEALSSGAGWAVLYHFGPAVMIGMVWLLAALPIYWSVMTRAFPVAYRGIAVFTAPIGGLLVVVTLLIALRAMVTLDEQSARSPQPRPGSGSYAQVSAIEREVEGLDPSKVLLDTGNWMYLSNGYLAKDRVVALADQPVAGIYRNFEPLLQRIYRREYDKILLHNFDTDLFLYDWPYWRRSSGVRQALADNYTEARVIPGMGAAADLPPSIMFRGAVSVLVPKAVPNQVTAGRP